MGGESYKYTPMGEGREGDETGQTASGSPPGMKGSVVTPKGWGWGFAALLSRMPALLATPTS